MSENPLFDMPPVDPANIADVATPIEGEAPEFERVELDDPDKLTFFEIKRSPTPQS